MASIQCSVVSVNSGGSYEKHFISKLSDADGEQLETQHWIDTAAHCSYLNTEQKASLLKQ